MDADRIGVALTDQNFQMTVLENPQPVLVACWVEGCVSLSELSAHL